jgi:fructuronate reductase
MVHLGAGAFFRAHQAWYTAVAEPHGDWGFAAFTGRSAEIAKQLSEQDDLYTLITRAAEGDSFEVVNSLASVSSGTDLNALVAAVANPETAVVTLTITEAGYAVDANGNLLDAHELLAGLRAGLPNTALARLAWALEQRRTANGQPIALVPCDNMPSNGKVLESAMNQLFAAFEPESLVWLEREVSFVSTSIDRITPKTTENDNETVLAETGLADASPVVTEPFSDWVLEGEFPLGRPSWEKAGARFVDDIEPFENRKLWLLNGSHSLLAYLGLQRGQETVAEAMADEFCRRRVDEFWDEAERNLPADGLDIASYRKALVSRFENQRIAHRLEQIAIDGSTKVRVRALPVFKAEVAAGRTGHGALMTVAAWVSFAISRVDIQDSRSAQVRDALAEAGQVRIDAIRGLVAILDSDLAASEELLRTVDQLTDQIHN